jgi:hypothetical protein
MLGNVLLTHVTSVNTVLNSAAVLLHIHALTLGRSLMGVESVYRDFLTVAISTGTNYCIKMGRFSNGTATCVVRALFV